MGRHSIWLLPQSGDEAMLRAVVEELSGQFGAPLFQPHLTLVEDMERSADELTPLAAKVAEGIAAFTAPVVGIGTSELYFRSFYARFEADGPLLELKKRAVEEISHGRIEEFMPHVSLLYGVAGTPDKDAARDGIERRLAGRSIRFDRVCVVASAKEIPVADWAVRSTAPLNAR